ncbi:glutaredoxin family protein [Schlesneria paludicola]|uniref:glutaredoxin family protein n=1 Tax=Schlesneria paludicola TaxID=360056 RepID=UPI00029AF977|nr:glutaredoxin family protein [Schlesneria paludicola]
MTYRPTGSAPENRLVPLGRGLFGGGLILLVLRGLQMTTQLPGLPSFWYSNQSLWVCLGFGMTALGWQILWGKPKMPESGWRPAVPGRRFRSVILYTKEGCHLCDEAAELLARYERWLPRVENIEIQSSRELTEQFQTCVPVIAFDGKIRFRGRVDEALLRRLIEGSPPQGLKSSHGHGTEVQ